MKNIYLFAVSFIAFLGLFLSLEINAQSHQQEQKTINIPGVDLPVRQNFSDSKSVFVNIIPDTACVFLNETFSLEGLVEASGYTVVQWLNLNGWGYFSNENILEPEFIPTPLDVLLDGVYLMIYVSDGVELATDIITLKVINLNAGESSTICSDQYFQTMAEVSEYESLLWTTGGDGTFSDLSALNPVYSPGANDIASGWVQLTLTATVASPCNISGSSSIDLYIISPPSLIVDLEDAEVELGQYVVMSIVAENANGYQWYGPQGMIDGATLPDLEIYEATLNDAGQYYCEFFNDCGSQVSSTKTLTVYQLQSFNIPAGWSGISSWIAPFDPIIENLFQPVENELVILENSTGTYNPAANINTLGLWDAQAGYQVKFDAPVNLVFKGQMNENQSVTLTQGWNYLPVVSVCDVDCASFFGGFAAVKMIKEIAGLELYWPDLNITSLQTLKPGNAYLIYVNTETNITFPTCTP